MVPCKAVVLPPVSVLPSTDPEFVRALDDTALLASGLIDALDAAALTIPMNGLRSGSVIAWNQRLAASPSLSGTLAETPMFAPALDALANCVDAIFDRLSTWGWAHIDAPGLCLVTDGCGVLISSEMPAPDADCDWLMDLARLDSERPFARSPGPDGIWALILADSTTAH